MKKLLLILPISLIIFAACQSDDDLRVSSTTITFGTTSGSVGMEWEKGQGTARAADEIPGEMPENIGVYAYYDKVIKQEVFNNQKVLYFYSDEYSKGQFQWDYWNRDTGNGVSAWPYTITPDDSEQKQWDKRNYRFWAYSPWTANGASVSTNDYNFNTLTWANIPEYSTCDHLVTNKIVAVNNTDGKRKTVEPVTFEMQHLMARIRFIFKMSEQYRQIRRIVINSVSVKAAVRQNSATITYKADNTLNTISWGGFTGATLTTIDLVKEKNAEYDVKTDYAAATSFASLYVLPQTGFEELTFTVNYSTYDSAGKETRNPEITNTVTLATPWNLVAGRYYDLKISIVPDYLYVLSDNDLDFDGWVIVKETNSPTPPTPPDS